MPRILSRFSPAFVIRDFAIGAFAVRAFAIGAILAGGLLGVPSFPSTAQAQEAELHRVKPLVIIRFNQPTVRYERALQSAVSRAMQAKPDVRFTLVSFAPAYGDAATQAQLAERSGTLANQVRERIQALGVTSDRIETVTRASGAITHSEVHILVR